MENLWISNNFSGASSDSSELRRVRRASLFRSIDAVPVGAKDVSIVADDERSVLDRDGHLTHAVEELLEWRSGPGEVFHPAVNDNELVPVGIGCDTSSKVTSVIGVVVNDVCVAFWRVPKVAITRINETAFGAYPEHIVGIPVRELTQRFAAALESLTEEWKPLSRIMTIDRAD